MDTAAQIGDAEGGVTHHSSAAEQLFAGPGEVRARCRAIDWAATPLGNVEGWPTSLCDAIRLMLDSGFAMSICAGVELVLLYNESFVRALGSTRHPRALGRPAREAWPEVWAQIEPEFAAVLAGRPGKLHTDQRFVPDRDRPGEETFWTYSRSPVRGEDGRVVAVHTVAMETTAHVRAEKALRASEAQLAIELADTQELQRLSARMIEHGDVSALDAEFLHTARALMRSDMASLQMLVAERDALFLLAQHGFTAEAAAFWEWVRADHTTSCGLALARGEPVIVPDVEQWDLVAGTEDLAQYRRCGIRAMLSLPLVSREGRLVGVTSVHWRDVHRPSEREMRLLDVLARQAADMIERRASQEAANIARTHAERDSLRRRLAQAEEDERSRLSRELHDEVGQHLTALGLGLQALSDVAPPGSEVDRRAEQLRALVSTMGRELHALAVRLRPKALDDFGLEAALAALVDDWAQQSGIAVDLHAPLDSERLPASIESAIYRIVQEALTNVARHSGATRASVVVERRDGHVRAIVEDNGHGFDPATTSERSDVQEQHTGLGMLGIRERAALLGGVVEIESSLGRGTALYARIPIDSPVPERAHLKGRNSHG